MFFLNKHVFFFLKLVNAINFACKWILLFPRSHVTSGEGCTLQAWRKVGPGPQDPGPRDPGTRDPGPPSKFKSGTRDPP